MAGKRPRSDEYVETFYCTIVYNDIRLTRNPCSTVRIVQSKLPHAGTWEVSQMQAYSPRSSLAKRRRADTLNLAYLKMLNVSHIDDK